MNCSPQSMNRISKSTGLMVVVLNRMKTVCAVKKEWADGLARGKMDISIDKDSCLCLKMKFPRGGLPPAHLLEQSFNSKIVVNELMRSSGLDSFILEAVESKTWEGRLYAARGFKFYLLQEQEVNDGQSTGDQADRGGDAGDGEAVPPEAE